MKRINADVFFVNEKQLFKLEAINNVLGMVNVKAVINEKDEIMDFIDENNKSVISMLKVIIVDLDMKEIYVFNKCELEGIKL